MVVREKIIQQDMYYKNNLVMKYTIKYPQFISTTYQTLANKLNNLYRTKAVMYERTNVMNMYQMAMVEYEYSIANNFPMHQFEAYVDYSITYNQNCLLSLYYDQYEYAGGAHGLTIRYSDTWNLPKSKRVDLYEMLLPCHRNSMEYVIQTIDKQIEKEMGKEEKKYFEDYAKLVKENFKVNNFYLTKEGIVIYFQQYDIAPYAYGIPTFTIPYCQGGEAAPGCSN